MYVLTQDGESKIDMRNIHSMDVGIGPVIRLFSSDDKSGTYYGVAWYDDYDIANLVLSDLENRLTDDPYYIYQMPQGNEQWIRDTMSDLKDGWISTADHLPEPGTEVIVTVELKTGQRVVRAATYTEFGFSGNGNMNNVKAWIKMPEIYKGDLA